MTELALKEQIRSDVLNNIKTNMDDGVYTQQLNRTDIKYTSYLGPDPDHNFSLWFQDNWRMRGDSGMFGQVLSRDGGKPDPIYSVWALLCVSIFIICMGIYLIRRGIRREVKYRAAATYESEADDVVQQERDENIDEEEIIFTHQDDEVSEVSEESSLGFTYKD